MIKTLFTCLLFTLGVQVALSQATAKIVDIETGEGLPNADIQINGTDNIISNTEGYFTIPGKNSADNTVVTVSYLGYSSAKMTVGELKNNQLIIKLKPGIFELQSVNVSNLNLANNPDSIMAAVKRNLARNYRSAEKPVKNMLFYRETSAFRPIKLKAEMTKSTGHKKKELNGANAELKAFASKLISHPPQQFTDMLAHYYTAKKTVKDKPANISKFDVVKAVKLKDKNRSVELKELQEKVSGIVFKHLDSTKFYRMKSGLFGTRDTVLYARGHQPKKEKEKKSSASSAKSGVMTLMSYSNFAQSPDLDFITKQELYEYTYEGLTQSQDNEWIYIINFAPKKRKAKYTGTLYVSEKDFAVVRADYELGKGKTLGGVNLKFILGVKQSENLSKGTLIFKERENEPGYYLQYASRETGSYIYLNRPLKFIEITEADDRDEVGFDLKVEANMVDKDEYFVMSRTEITEADFDKAKESEINFIHLDNYDPNIWKEYSAIEPLQEMKQFRTVE